MVLVLKLRTLGSGHQACRSIQTLPFPTWFCISDARRQEKNSGALPYTGVAHNKTSRWHSNRSLCRAFVHPWWAGDMNAVFWCFKNSSFSIPVLLKGHNISHHLLSTTGWSIYDSAHVIIMAEYDLCCRNEFAPATAYLEIRRKKIAYRFFTSLLYSYIGAVIIDPQSTGGRNAALRRVDGIIAQWPWRGPMRRYPMVGKGLWCVLPLR